MTGESPNDRNDRAIMVAAQWYKNHFGSPTKILMITNDKKIREATEERILAETVESYMKSLGQPALLDLLVQTHVSEDMEIEDLRLSKKKVIYSKHKPMSEITTGMRCGIYNQGKLRVNRYNPCEAYFGSESIGDEIIIARRRNMNRAFDGDIVAVDLLPQDQWHSEKSLHIAEEDDEGVHLAPSSADDAPRIANVAQGSSDNANYASPRPSGCQDVSLAFYNENGMLIVDLWSQCLCQQEMLVLPMLYLSPMTEISKDKNPNSAAWESS